MRLITLHFKNSPPMYSRMVDALQNSIAANSPNHSLEVYQPQDADLEIFRIGHKNGRQEMYTQNTRKTKHQCEIVQQAAEGELLCFLDSDMMVLKTLQPLEERFSEPVFGYTAKPYEDQIKLNTGLVIVRVTDKTRAFFKLWYDSALKLLADKKLHNELKHQYGGINQCSLAVLLKQHPDFLICELPTGVWNSCQVDHINAMQQAHIVHILGRLRSTVMQYTKPKEIWLQQLAAKWREYDCVSVA